MAKVHHFIEFEDNEDESLGDEYYNAQNALAHLTNEDKSKEISKFLSNFPLVCKMAVEDRNVFTIRFKHVRAQERNLEIIPKPPRKSMNQVLMENQRREMEYMQSQIKMQNKYHYMLKNQMKTIARLKDSKVNHKNHYVKNEHEDMKYNAKTSNNKPQKQPKNDKEINGIEPIKENSSVTNTGMNETDIE